MSTLYSGMFLTLLAFSSSLVGARADPEIDFAGIYVSFAEWCTPDFCNLRFFTVIGGELLMIDSGSSSLAFCEAPNPDYVTELSHVAVYDEDGESNNISQCMLYGRGDHGWYGNTYTGTIETAGKKGDGQIFTIMEKHVGLNGNQCGPIFGESIGLADSSVRGIMGIGRNDRYTYSDAINRSTWTDIAVSSGVCGWGECQCAQSVASGLNSTFLSALNNIEITQFAITWDGTLGENSGKMLWNEDAGKDIPEFKAKVPIEMDPQRSFGMFSTNVTRMVVDGVDMNVTQRQYIFDTGAGYINLPSEISESIKDGSVVTFTMPAMDWEYGNTTDFNITVTQELIDAKVFRYVPAGSNSFFGLNIFRYFDKILINLDEAQPYFLASVRETPILELPAKLPVGKLAGSISNEMQQKINATTIDSTNIISTAIMNSTGVTPASAAANIRNTGMVLTNVALAVATLAVILF